MVIETTISSFQVWQNFIQVNRLRELLPTHVHALRISAFQPQASGVASMGARGQSAPLDSEKIAKNREQEEENQEKSEKGGENQEKIWEELEGKNREGSCPSWQIGLAMLLPQASL